MKQETKSNNDKYALDLLRIFINGEFGLNLLI